MSLETEAQRSDIQLLPFALPEPSHKIGLAWRKSSPRRRTFDKLGAMSGGLFR